ncbi:receptor-like serine/threonine-protein kinase NCRK isoform X1 [Populus alba]|uniref:receptor-like serine/threonine-protein kinase NCRK isoform X1 n=1 Tax=Populus alba TaxID=43335 RepID=UPI00158C773F|nr:receptor-like serine/threonine-protein kinase NCRK isoform X1 [Populus alba]XP_034901123.1 receptor-like serine/threonine-protein kinase NCRK isoform X1 [Populus alba]XP_034901124.1 receptor-like serine/threonine-protein kinase NCRK isoform X1 [Populus alba]
MKLQLKVAFACLVGVVWIQQGFCDELSTKSGINNWTCTCSASYQGNQSYTTSNCSTSCDCSPVGGGKSRGTWTCTCSTDGLPKVAAGSQDTTCFTACNCTSGSLTDVQATRKHISSKIVVILSCVILTTLAFLASTTWYLCREDKCPIQSPTFSSDRETSCNSATNLISHRASSVSETKIHVDSPINPISGCFRKASFLCRSKTEIIHGTLICFAYSELEHATDKFSHSNLIGLGGSSYVYRGQLKDGTTVAVKRLTAQGGTDADLLFSREVELLAKLHHCHVVPLLGYCSEFQGKLSERLLVFEYMPNGNLRDCLDGIMGENMNWQTRVTIAIGAARGLEYLHEAAAPRILHRDVKSTNILMDELWRAKITDLGMAKRLRADGVPSSSSSPARMQGTFGYFAPEYAMIGRASLMSDVFSFGVVLLEVITGRQPIHKTTNKVEESLVSWATPRLQDSRRVISELPDPRLKGNFPEEELQIMAYLAKECLLMDPDSRPSMSEVVQILSTIAPEKSKRRNIPVSLFQMSSIQSVTTDPYKEKPDSRAEDPVDVDRNLFVGSCIEGADNISTKYMERLIISTSKPHSWGAADDEAVDLTEPRLESFCVENVESA